MFRGMNVRQIVMDCICIALCVLTLAAVLLLYRSLPEKIPINFDFSGVVTRYSGKSSIFLLLGILVLMTGSFSALVRIPAVYRRMNMPWPIPWGREGLLISLTKDFICVTNLCCTVGNVYLVYACLRGRLLQWLLWLPYVGVAAALVWFLVKARKICKG